jgi:uncharacterized protein YjbJ (UPF0337 family)
MNEQQVKGKLKEGAGEVQEHVGRALGDREQEAKGHAREQEGKVQKKLGDLQEAAEDVVKKP